VRRSPRASADFSAAASEFTRALKQMEALAKQRSVDYNKDDWKHRAYRDGVAASAEGKG
jgi:hypothetical protein